MAAARRLDGEGAAMPVLEAILVAILVATSLVFFSLVQRPSARSDDPAGEEAQLARDSLNILADATLSQPASCGSGGVAVDEAVRLLMRGGACSTDMEDEVRSLLAGLLPEGTRWVLRLGNGLDALDLAASEPVSAGASTADPKGGQVASAFVLPDWLDAAAPTQTRAPGEAFTLPIGTLCIQAPPGTGNAPRGQTWLSLWNAEPAGQVPDWAPFGDWRFWTGAPDGAGACTGLDLGTVLQVVLDASTTTERALYRLDLVVWDAA